MFRKLFGPSSPPFEPQVAADHRVYAIGDIHGRADLLTSLLAQLAEDAAARADGRRVKYVFLGDYIDRGEDSRGVLEQVSARQAADPGGTIYLMGNHEAFLLAFLDDPEQGSRWLGYGGDRTLRSYGISAAGQPPEAIAEALKDKLGPHLTFLTGLERLWQSGDFLFVHAALDPRRALDAQEDRDMLWGNARFLRKGYPEACVVHGHYDDPEPVQSPTRICVDTGAYYSDRLTAVCLDEEIRFLQTV